MRIKNLSLKIEKIKMIHIEKVRVPIIEMHYKINQRKQGAKTIIVLVAYKSDSMDLA
jgi:hypothetical protein